MGLSDSRESLLVDKASRGGLRSLASLFRFTILEIGREEKVWGAVWDFDFLF